jgi:hypothetical protein
MHRPQSNAFVVKLVNVMYTAPACPGRLLKGVWRSLHLRLVAFSLIKCYALHERAYNAQVSGTGVLLRRRVVFVSLGYSLGSHLD